MPTIAAPVLQSGLTAGAAAIWWKSDVSASQWLVVNDAADDIDEQRPAQDGVNGGRGGPRPDAHRQDPDAEEA